MSDNKELLLLSNLSPGDDRVFLERLQGCINHRNSHGPNYTKALRNYSGSQIKQVVVGPDHIAFLFCDNKVGRVSFKTVEVKPPVVTETEKTPATNNAPTVSVTQSTDQTSTATSGSTGNQQSGASATYAAVANVANRSAKIRRVMMATRRAGQFATRGGVIVDRGRQLIPAASIPEDLIAQAQVVLQGKSREVIVRELQRTNLNVNEAVNNLLSREDDDEDMDDGSDSYLPEELLSLLDAGLRSSDGIMEPDSLYSGEGYEYLMSREFSSARRREGRNDTSRAKPAEVNMVREKFEFGDEIEFWTSEEQSPFPPNVKKFTKIAAFQGELLALTDAGYLYGWKWKEKGDLAPHPINTAFFGNQPNDYFVDVETSAYRAVVLTAGQKMGSFFDAVTLGQRISETLFMPLIDVPDGETVETIHVCPMFAAIKTSNSFYWWGINPFNERRRVFEKTKSKAKKYQSNSTSDIKVGSEVRTKSNPVYAANSVAVNLTSSTPMIGILMENAWSLTETCRFRIYTPEQYDQLKEEKSKDDKKAVNLSVRKRAAPSDDQTGSSTIPIKETAWAIKDVFFIHEEPCNDTGIVQIVDGPMCGIYFKSYIEERKKNGDGSLDVSKLRLMRKDDLVVVHGGSKQPCSPITFEKIPQRVSFPHGIRRVISVVVDNSGFRMLVEKKGRVHLMRMSTLGKLSSDHQLPVSYSAICGPHDGDSRRSAKLFNYGDDNILVLQDHNGALSPLVRNAAGGFSDPIYLGIAGMNHLAVGLKYLPPGAELSGVICSGSIEKLNKPDTARSGNKLLFMAALIAPSPKEIVPQLPSLIQLVLFCDLDGVAMFLKTVLELRHEIDEESFNAFIDEYITDVRADGNRTVLHVAVMNAFAKTNALQNEANDKAAFEALDTSEADAHRQKMDRQWEEMIAGAKIPKMGDVEMKDGSLSNDGVQSPAMGLVDLPMEFRTGKAVYDPRARQSNAISILKLFMDSDVVRTRLDTLFHVRDVNGHTPLISAVQNRAYEAATVIWDAMKKFYGDSSVDDFTTQVYNPMIHNDDSPLFIVCYNDTCSFTWTGDEHINQDIFECKTCGLTGSLCCCTECANTCHRNHDCKLKRTSPTAYCDCWEKCSCRALVAGNEKQREYLLNELLTKTNLICQPNIRGEHLLLFLVKTVGRQLIEQENYGKRSRNRASANQAGNGNDHVPERDLEPPKFADRALKVCLGSWAAVKSLISIGMKKRNDGTIISEELFHLSAQNGSTHLDKFVFTLLNKCPEPHLDLLLNTLMNAASRTGDERDPDVDAYVSRFIRSVIRMFSLITLIAPSTLAMTIQSAAANAEDDKLFKYSTAAGESKSTLPPRTSVTISGVISLVRSIPIVREDRNKDKKRQVNSFTQKCRRIFQALPTYSVAELLNTADAYMGPVRTGFINPALNISRAMHSTDALDYIEKYLNGEQDLSSALDVNGELRSVRRRRYGSRRDNDEEAANANEQAGNANADSDESESDSENEAISRRFSSQGSLHGHNTSSLNNIVETYRRNEPPPPQSSVSRPANSGAADRGEYSTDSVSSASDDEENEDSSDEEESDNEPTFGVSDTFNNDEFEEDEEIRENEEEEEDYYDEDGEEEAGQEFGDDAHDEDEAEYENDEETNNDRTVPVVEVEPVEQAPEPEEGEIVVGNEMEVENVANSENINPEEAVEMNDEELMNAMSNDAVSVTIAPESEAIGMAVSNDVPDVARTRSRVVRSGISSSSGNRARNLTWAVPGDFTASRRDDGNGNELAIRTSNAPGNEAGANDQSGRVNKGTSGVPHIDDAHASSEKTAFQFSSVFSALLKLVDDLLLQMTRPALVSAESSKEKAFPRPLKIDFKIVKALRDHVDEKLTPTWQWLTIVLDKVEAQLKFGSALNSSAIFATEVQEKKSEKERKYKPKETAPASTSKRESPQGRKEFLQYFFSTARAHAGEDGDELPIIEYRALRTAAFVAEAFLFHASVLELIDSRIQSRLSMEGSPEFDAEEMARAATAATPLDVVPTKKLKQFYQRSNSICYPCISFADPHNAFQYSTEECLPLALRPQLLQSDADRCQLFTLPIPQRDRTEHVAAAKSHGITNPTFHSLADLPTSYSELRDLLSEKMKTTTVPSRSLWKTYIADEPLKNEQSVVTVDDLFAVESSVSRMPLQRLLGRWSNSFSLITQMYTEDLVHYCGGDATYSVILVETAGFHFRQSHFRKRIEKLKNGQPRDLVFSGLCREKNTLIVQTFRSLNQQYQKRMNNSNGSASMVLKVYSRSGYDPNAAVPPLASHKVKVTFKDEPGEGTGVARSFYSAVAEALTTLPNMPQDGFEPEDDKKKTPHPTASNTTDASSNRRYSPPKRLARGALQAIQASIGRRVSTRRRQELNTKVDPYFPPEHPTPEPKVPETRPMLTSNKKLAAERLFNKVYNCEPVFAHKVTAMLLEFPIADVVNMISCDDTMKAYLIEAVKLLQTEGYVNSLEKENDAVHLREDAPFFVRIESSGHYVPLPATCSENRLNAFRNVGRMIGICLQQREIFPIQLARHVLKFILGKPLTWFDLAFFDPKLFDSMRSLIYDDDTGNPRPKEFYETLEMNYVMTFSEREGGTTVELKAGGEDVALTRDNILEYFYLFVEKRLLGPAIPVLEAMKKGVFDVIPSDCLNHLTPEDLRLILCGSPEINISLLESYTKFLDESSSSSDTLEKYKQTFWSVVNKFTHQEKQDLIFFWTGSPTLPATEEEFQPLPTIMIRPSDNNLHLPTANTCISRLYLPLYTSKRVLRAKLLLAIKARNFGFV